MNEKRINFIAGETDYKLFKNFCEKNKMTVSKMLRILIIWAPIFMTSPEWYDFKKRIEEKSNGTFKLWNFDKNPW